MRVGPPVGRPNPHRLHAFICATAGPGRPDGPRVWAGGSGGGRLAQNVRRGAELVPATIVSPRACVDTAVRSNPARPTYSRLKAKDTHGLSHQEAPQAHGEEEAPQAAAQDASPASQQEVARNFMRGPSQWWRAFVLLWLGSFSNPGGGDTAAAREGGSWRMWSW